MKLINNKILMFFLLTFVFFIFLNMTTVFGSFDFTYNNTNYSLPDLPFDIIDHPDFLIVIDKNKNYQVCYPSSTYQIPFYYQNSKDSKYQGIQYWSNNDTEKVIVGNISNGLNWCYYSLSSSSSSWSSMQTTKANQIQTLNSFDNMTRSVIYSSVNIINEDGSVFFLAPVPMMVVPVLETAEELPKAILGTLKTIIPVCLVLLAVVLLVYLIRRLRYLI